MGAVPNHPFLGIFHIINIYKPAIGVPPSLWKPPAIATETVARRGASKTEPLIRSSPVRGPSMSGSSRILGAEKLGKVGFHQVSPRIMRESKVFPSFSHHFPIIFPSFSGFNQDFFSCHGKMMGKKYS